MGTKPPGSAHCHYSAASPTREATGPAWEAVSGCSCPWPTDCFTVLAPKGGAPQGPAAGTLRAALAACGFLPARDWVRPTQENGPEAAWGGERASSTAGTTSILRTGQCPLRAKDPFCSAGEASLILPAGCVCVLGLLYEAPPSSWRQTDAPSQRGGRPRAGMAGSVPLRPARNSFGLFLILLVVALLGLWPRRSHRRLHPPGPLPASPSLLCDWHKRLLTMAP